MDKETRTLSLDRVSLRADSGRFVGHASTFGDRYPIGDPKRFGFWEQMDRRAFDRAVADQQDVVMLVDHEGMPLARTTSGTLELRTDKRGLLVEADLPDTSLGRDVKVLMERGDLSQMSIGFFVKKDTWDKQDDGTMLRTIEDVDLFDVSVVKFPANPGTDAAVRAAGFNNESGRRFAAEARERLDALKRTLGA